MAFALGLRLGFNTTMNFVMQAKTHLEKNNVAEAVSCYRLALKEKWDTPMALFAVDRAVAAGLLVDGHQMLGEVLAREPHHTSAVFVQGMQELFISPVNAWGLVLGRLGALPLDDLQKLVFLQYRLIESWLMGRPWDEVQALCNEVDICLQPWREAVKSRMKPTQIPDRIWGNMQGLAAYGSMIRRVAGLQYGPRGRKSELPALLVLGDSHSVPPHCQRVMWQGKVHQVVSDVVVGVKAWHVANMGAFPYGQYMKAKLQRYEGAMPVMFSIGEIDTRWDQGMWPQIRKGRLVSDVVAATLIPAAKQLAGMAKGRAWGVMGIPAPHIEAVAKLPEHEREGYVAMVAAANHMYGQAVRAEGGVYADMYALTVDEVGIRKPDLDLDFTHVHPSALGLAVVG